MIFFQYFASSVANITLRLLVDWISRKSVNYTNPHNKTLYNNVKLISLGKIFNTHGTIRRGGWNSMFEHSWTPCPFSPPFIKGKGVSFRNFWKSCVQIFPIEREGLVLISMLMMLLSTLSVINHLICVL